MKKSILLPFLFVVFFSLNAFAQTTLVPRGSSWKYLGNGDGDEATVVSYGADANNKYITTYFRKSFTVANPADFNSLTLDILRDDGAVVYLNGTEIYRNNMPAGP